MADLTFRRVRTERKTAMLEFVQKWQRSNKPAGVLEEGLRILAEPGRWEKLRAVRENGNSGIFGIATDFSKDVRGLKGALPRNDAKNLLELVLRVRGNMPLGQEDNAELFTAAFGRVARTLLNGERPQIMNGAGDLVQDIVYSVIRGINPSLAEPILL